jgi:hypothetical protein
LFTNEWFEEISPCACVSQRGLFYASFDQIDVEMQRNRSNSEIGAEHKVMSRPKKTTKELSGMRRHTTGKMELASAPRPSLFTTLLKAQIAEAEESPKGR